MSTPTGTIPGWLIVLAAQLLVGILVLNIYLARIKNMEESAVQSVTFERLGGTDFHEQKLHVKSPGTAEVNIRSSAGAGGYAMMVLDVRKQEETPPTEKDLKSINLAASEVQGRLEAPVVKHGVTAARPVIKQPEPRPGAPQLYTGTIEVKNPGNYSVVYAQLRPWEPNGHRILYVVHVEAD